jgi:dTDP-4-dehydrorhamnose 3,5-epimerase
MIFVETSPRGAYVVEVEKHEDEWDFIARSWCAREFFGKDLDHYLFRCDVSSYWRKGMLRGRHYQISLHVEVS